MHAYLTTLLLWSLAFLHHQQQQQQQFTARVVVAAAVLDHDEWEFYGGRKRRRTHGLNSLIIDKDNDDSSTTTSTKSEGTAAAAATTTTTTTNEKQQPQPQIIVTNDEAALVKNNNRINKNDYGGIVQRLLGRSRSRSGSNNNKDDDGIIYALPDRFSVLDFDSTTENYYYSSDGDYQDEQQQQQQQQQQDEVEEQDEEKSLAEKSWWGRVYVDGFPGSFQYFRAHFGVPPPPSSSSSSSSSSTSSTSSALKFVLADPPTACDSEEFLPMLSNADEMDENTIVVVVRGDCTFGEKAIEIHKAGALGILFVNNEDGNQHPSGPEAQDINLTVSMISKDDGMRLIEALNSTKSSGKDLVGRFVSIHCGKHQHQKESTTNVGSYCEPVRASDRKFVSELSYDGTLTTLGIGVHTFDYVQAEFGGWINSEDELSLVKAQDDYCCDKETCGKKELLEGKAVLVRRGNCDFATKAEVLTEMHAKMMILSNNNATIFRMGVEPDHRGRKIRPVAVMVSSVGGEKLENAILQNNKELPVISLQRNEHVTIESIEMDNCVVNSSHYEQNGKYCARAE